jgi:hypothetical protein
MFVGSASPVILVLATTLAISLVTGHPADLFHLNTPVDAIMSLIQPVMVLYPPYLLLAIAHDEYTRKKIRELYDRLDLGL